MKQEKCEMALIEGSDMELYWECSHCQMLFKDTNRFERNTECPNCGKKIVEWIEYDYE